MLWDRRKGAHTETLEANRGGVLRGCTLHLASKILFYFRTFLMCFCSPYRDTTKSSHFHFVSSLYFSKLSDLCVYFCYYNSLLRTFPWPTEKRNLQQLCIQKHELVLYHFCATQDTAVLSALTQISYVFAVCIACSNVDICQTLMFFQVLTLI